MSDAPRVTPHPSPNHGPRRDGLQPELIVLHGTEMPVCAEALERLCDPAAEVSSHYLISEQGEIWQLVDEAQRAWHAGAGSWGAKEDVNSRSIGIEISHSSDTPFSEPAMTALEALLPGIMARWSIKAQGVIAHSDMAPRRKTDPGERFDWRRLARQGLSVWPQANAPAQGTFLDHAIAFGYPAEAAAADLLAAFRLRFRPLATGPLDEIDTALAADLAQRFPVDPNGANA